MGARELLDDLVRDGFNIVADGDRLVIRPASKLTDDLRQMLRAAKPELMAMLNGATNDPTRTCRACTNRLPAGNCDKPREAGLLPDGSKFEIVFAPRSHAATCPAFTPSVRASAPRPYRLSPAEGDVAHSAPWDDSSIARFSARLALLMRRGFNATDADDLAERLHLRDVTADGRVICAECRHLTGRPGAWYCGNPRAAGVADELPDALVTAMQRCDGFEPTQGKNAP